MLLAASIYGCQKIEDNGYLNVFTPYCTVQEEYTGDFSVDFSSRLYSEQEMNSPWVFYIGEGYMDDIHTAIDFSELKRETGEKTITVNDIKPFTHYEYIIAGVSPDGEILNYDNNSFWIGNEYVHDNYSMKIKINYNSESKALAISTDSSTSYEKAYIMLIQSSDVKPYTYIFDLICEKNPQELDLSGRHIQYPINNYISGKYVAIIYTKDSKMSNYNKIAVSDVFTIK